MRISVRRADGGLMVSSAGEPRKLSRTSCHGEPQSNFTQILWGPFKARKSLETDWERKTGVSAQDGEGKEEI